jgi:hypothetical protein
MPRPGSTPQKTPPAHGRPGSTPQYAKPAEEIDALIAHNETLIAHKQSVMKDSNPFKTKYMKLAELSGKTHHEISQLVQNQIEELSGLIEQEGAFVIVAKNLGFSAKIVDDALKVQPNIIPESIDNEWIILKGDIIRKSAKAVAVQFNHPGYDGEMWVPGSCIDLTYADPLRLKIKTWFWNKKKEEIAQPNIIAEAADLEALIDAEYDTVPKTPYPPHAKVADPLESKIITPAEVTLAMLDGADQYYYQLIEEQAAILPQRDGKKPSAYWDLNKKIDLQKQLLVSLGRKWRAQQDRLMREALDRNTKAREGGK